jgi:hypothetical protein
MYIILGSVAFFLILLFAEHYQRLRNRPRLGTFLHACAKVAQFICWKIGEAIAKLSDVLKLIRMIWEFIHKWIPFGELLHTLLSVVVPLLQIVVSPLYIFKGYGETLLTFAGTWPITMGVTTAALVLLYILITDVYMLRTNSLQALLALVFNLV